MAIASMPRLGTPGRVDLGGLREEIDQRLLTIGAGNGDLRSMAARFWGRTGEGARRRDVHAEVSEVVIVGALTGQHM
jgi:hypothetical protein